MKKLLFSISVAGLLTMGACNNDSGTGPGNEPEEPDGPGVTKLEIPYISYLDLSQNEKPANAALNDAAWKILSTACQNPNKDGNVVFSPVSLEFAISMLANSCDEEMSQKVGELFGQNDLESINSLSNKLIRYLSNPDRGAYLNTANSVWYNMIYTPSDSWKEKMQSTFYADVCNLDFFDNSNTKYINDWCSQKTNGLINELFQEFPSDVALLINATLYQGKWQEPFDIKNTESKVFHGLNGDADVPMMRQNALHEYYADGRFEIVKIQISGGSHMYLILPVESDNAIEALAGITSADWKEINQSGNYGTYNVDLTLPKFKLGSVTGLRNILGELGIPLIATLKDMGITNALGIPMKILVDGEQHNALELDEEGVKAAAVTWIGLVSSTGDEPEFKNKTVTFDRPFMYVIEEHSTGTIIQAGVINNIG